MEEPVNLESSSEALSKRLKANTKRIKRKHQRIKGIPAQLNLYQLSQYVNKRSILAQTDLYQLSRYAYRNTPWSKIQLQNWIKDSKTHKIWAIASQYLDESLTKRSRLRFGFLEYWKGREKDEEHKNILKVQNVKFDKKKWSKSNDFLAVASLPYSESLPKRSL